jgi:DNA-binding transcriptional LysR family regulator
MRKTLTTRPDDMLVFTAVLRAGSFSRAADELGMTKQGVSARVVRLERALGVRLIERTTRKLRATDAGSVYFERCQSIATQIDEANDAARERQSEPVGVLRVASPTLYGRRFLTPVIARYVSRYPRVQVAITLTNRPVDLIGDGFDLAIQVGRLKDSNFTARRLGDARLYYVASAEYLAAHGAPAAMDLPDARCLGFRSVEEWRVGEHRVRIAPVVAINDVEAICDLAIAGAGIAQLPDFVCDEAIRDGRLVRLYAEANVSVRQISVLYPSRQFLAARVERFLDVLGSATRR